MIEFYGWYDRKIPVPPVTMAAWYFLAEYVLFILFLHQNDSVKPESTDIPNYRCITFCMILSRTAT